MANQQDQQEMQTFSQENLHSLEEEQLQNITGGGWSCCGKSETSSPPRAPSAPAPALAPAPAVRQPPTIHLLEPGEQGGMNLIQAQNALLHNNPISVNKGSLAHTEILRRTGRI